jgi:hypothetical protein
MSKRNFTVCSITGCELEISPKSARGMCRPHYRKFLKYGDPHVVKLGRPLETRFAEKLADAESGCLEWQGRKNKHGYGIFCIGHTEKVLAHRFAWQMMRGEIPKGLNVLHRCDNPKCVKLDHLFVGTQADNVADMWAKGRWVPRGLAKTKAGAA